MRDRDRDGVPNRYDNYDNVRGDRYDQYGNRYTRDRDRDGAPNSRNRIDATTQSVIADSDACGYEKKPVRSRSDGQRTQGMLY